MSPDRSEPRSQLAKGWIRHRRTQPKTHEFEYPIMYLLLDLDEMPTLFQRSRLWSLEKSNLVSFQRRDFLAHPEKDLKRAVIDRVREDYPNADIDRVEMLSHLRYWGHCFNPVSFYFCRNADGELTHIVSEINNTPWNERFSYVHSVTQNSSNHPNMMTFKFAKAFHVSPFMPMDLTYLWKFYQRDDTRVIHMELQQDTNKLFDATLHLEQSPLSVQAMNTLPFRYGLTTMKTVARIYWQAFRLWLKQIPFFSHPDKLANEHH